MTNRLDAARLQPLALRVAIAAAVLAAVALLAQWQYGGRASERAASGATLAALAQSIPLEAAAAAAAARSRSTTSPPRAPRSSTHWPPPA